MRSKGFLIDQIALRLYPNGIKSTSPVQREDIEAAINQKINYLYKGVQFNEVYRGGETIPSSAFLMTFDNVKVASLRGGKSQIVLPAMPINLPRNMGVFSIEPFFSETEAEPEVPNISVAFLTTVSLSEIDGDSAVSGGHIVDDGGSTITAKGVCWSSVPSPTVLNNRTIDGSDNFDFISNITGLTQGQTYYVRAYAANGAGTSYGNQLSFVATTFFLLLNSSSRILINSTDKLLY